MKAKTKRYDDGGNVVRTRTDDEIAADNRSSYARYQPKTKEYSLDEVKGKLSGLFGGSRDTSKFDELESVGGPGRRARSIEEQIGRKAEAKPAPKAETKEPESVAGKGAENLALDNTPSKNLTREESSKNITPPQPKAKPKAKPKKEATNVSSGASGFDTDDKGIARRRMEGLKEHAQEQERKKGQGLTPYAKGEKFTGSIEDWASKIKKAREAKQSGMKKGGTVSSASKRGDGIAQRGKTRGRMV